MRIKGLTPVFLSSLKSQKLKNTTVVVDGQSVYFSLYEKADIPYAFGCESDKFADFLKTYLDKFKKANLQCYFVCKGRNTNEEMLENQYEANNRLHGLNYVPSGEGMYDNVVKPIFSKDVWFQTLNEMGFKYVICNNDYITECIALALKLKCPVIGNNVQFFFSQVAYIPEINTKLDENNNLLCGIYTFSNFLRTFNLTEEKIILFIMMTDNHIFDDDVFKSFFTSKNMLTRYGKVNFKNFLTWLSKRSTKEVSAEILKVLSKSNQALYKEKKSDLETLVQERKKTDTKLTLYVMDENKAKFTQSDPDWFEKGVFFDFIAIPYINLYRYKIIKASNFIEDYEQENSIMVSIDIVKYAFDLLTNFEGGEMNIEHKKRNHPETGQPLKYGFSIRKPDYKAKLSVFENGWDNIKELNLFKHFITESLQTFDFARLDGAPSDSKLLLIALVYFSRKKPEAKLEIYSILLSYVMLDVVYEKLNKNTDAFNSNEESLSKKRKFLDSFTDKDLVTVADCEVAGSLMSTYFELRGYERCKLFDRKTLHPLVEFTRCLEELNYLNQLCGSEFEPTVYRKTFNGTFVYKVLSAMKGQKDGLEFIKKKLSPAPTVLAFFTGMLGIYESVLYE